MVRTGVDIEAIANTEAVVPFQLKVERPIILFPRGISKIYNPEIIAKAIGILDEEILKKYVFIFLKAACFDQDEWDKVTSVLEGQENVEYQLVDFLNQEQIRQLNRASKLVVMIPDSDGTPNSAIEAMAAGTKLIMGNCLYDKDLFNDEVTEFLIEYQPEKLRDKIKTILNSNNEEKLKKAFQVVREKADWYIEMGKIDQFYQS